jgi:hypothetical protein
VTKDEEKAKFFKKRAEELQGLESKEAEPIIKSTKD